MKKSNWQKVDGILLLNKPAGLSSNQTLQRARRIFQAKKAGHTGNLDPFATGMLPVCFGEATKFSQLLLDAGKTYQAVGTFGHQTDSGDLTGEKINEAPLPEMDTDAFRKLLDGFVGEIKQVPPMYSALKHHGKRLYELARQGIEVERKQRTVHIHRLELLDYSAERFEIRVACSKGTYIRTLVEDIAKAAGSVAYTASLHRLAVEPFPVEQMVSLEALTEVNETAPEQLHSYLLGIDAGLVNLPSVNLSGQATVLFRHGQRLGSDEPDGIYKVYDPELNFLGLAESVGGLLKVKRLIQQ